MPTALARLTTFHDALFAEREQRGLTQTQLAEALGTSQQNVASWESGRSVPRARTLTRLLDYFGPDSPLAALAPKGRLETAATVRLVPKDSDAPAMTGDLRSVWREAVGAQPFANRPDLQALLPEKYRRFVEPALRLGNRDSRPDYWSPALGLEFFLVRAAAPPLSILMKARSSMQQLLVWNQAQPEEQRKLALVVVAEDAGSILQGSILERITTESAILNIEVVYTSALDGVAHVIEQVEAGKPISEDDE